MLPTWGQISSGIVKPSDDHMSPDSRVFSILQKAEREAKKLDRTGRSRTTAQMVTP
jgi:hypothetical protein